MLSESLSHRLSAASRRDSDHLRLSLGRLHATRVTALGPRRALREAEFSVFSQWGEDGIIQYLISQVDIAQDVFVEFGVESYREANTRFLLLNDNWRGLIMDASEDHMAAVRGESLFWRHELTAIAEFVTRENINELISRHVPDQDIGILSIDIDGNDYWVWDAITAVTPRIVVCEYNGAYGDREAVAVPYDPGFSRTRAHYSNLHYGCSLAALCHLAERKGYVFVGSNSAGCNAFFVRRDLAGNLAVLTAAGGFIAPRFRDSRDRSGELTFLPGGRKMSEILDMEVCDVISGERRTVGSLVVPEG